MKFAKITLKAPSPTLRTSTVTSADYDITTDGGFVVAKPRNGGDSLAWPYGHISEATLLEAAAVKPTPKVVTVAEGLARLDADFAEAKKAKKP